MVAWSLDDAMAITAVSDLTLKIWDAHKGNLLFNLAGHEDEIFVLEPHPYAMNLLLTGNFFDFTNFLCHFFICQIPIMNSFLQLPMTVI